MNEDLGIHEHKKTFFAFEAGMLLKTNIEKTQSWIAPQKLNKTNNLTRNTDELMKTNKIGHFLRLEDPAKTP